MLDSKESNRRSDNNEAAVKEQFENLGYVVDKLDGKASKGRRPDFLISDRARQRQLLCEVKTVDSGGYLHDKGVHVSTHDETLGKFKCRVSLRKIDDNLANAVRKRDALVEHDSRFADLPLLVAFFFDPLAEFLPFHPLSFDKRDDRFPEVSGILTIKEDVVVPESFETLSHKEKGEFLRNALPSGLPRRTDFVLVKNNAALRVVPQDFARLCLPDAYYG
jgi:hypothetical protein